MKYKINTYFAMLLITVIGAGASMIIIRVAYANTFDFIITGGEASYALQQSMLKQ